MGLRSFPGDKNASVQQRGHHQRANGASSLSGRFTDWAHLLYWPDDSMEPPQQEQAIGVTRDDTSGRLGEPVEYLDYLPYTQSAWGFGDFSVRYSGDFVVRRASRV